MPTALKIPWRWDCRAVIIIYLLCLPKAEAEEAKAEEAKADTEDFIFANRRQEKQEKQENQERRTARANNTKPL